MGKAVKRRIIELVVFCYVPTEPIGGSIALTQHDTLGLFTIDVVKLNIE